MRVNKANSPSPSERRIILCNAVRSSLNRPSISSTASLLCRKTSRHIVGSEAAIRVKSRNPPAENLITSDSRDLREVGRRADDVVGDEMGHVAGDREHEVVMGRAHDFDVRRRTLPISARTFATAPSSVPSGGVRMHHRLMKRLANPASGPDCSVPATGCAGTRRAWPGSIGCNDGNHRAFDRPDIGDDRPGPKRRRDDAPDGLVGPDRHA